MASLKFPYVVLYRAGEDDDCWSRANAKAFSTYEEAERDISCRNQPSCPDFLFCVGKLTVVPEKEKGKMDLDAQCRIVIQHLCALDIQRGCLESFGQESKFFESHKKYTQCLEEILRLAYELAKAIEAEQKPPMIETIVSP